METVINQVLAFILITVAGYALKLAGDYIRAKSPGIDALMDKAADMAVKAVEQMDQAGLLDEADKKKDVALEIADQYINAQLAAKGIKIKVDLIVVSNLIEAKVWDIINSHKTQADPPGQG